MCAGASVCVCVAHRISSGNHMYVRAQCVSLEIQLGIIGSLNSHLLLVCTFVCDRERVCVRAFMCVCVCARAINQAC